jgi:hypothetical protein
MADPYGKPSWKTWNGAREQSMCPVTPTGLSQLGPRYEKVWLGELDPVTALQEAQAAIDETIAKNK